MPHRVISRWCRSTSRLGEGFDRGLGCGPVGLEVVLAAEKIVVHPRRMRDVRIDLWEVPRACPGAANRLACHSHSIGTAIISKPSDLPFGFDPRSKHHTGIAVLETGLPELPDVLDYRMSIPVASWTAAACAVVLFLEFSHHDDGSVGPVAMMMQYARDSDRWRPHRHVGGVGWSHDPVASPHDLRDLGGRVMVECGGSFTDSPAPGHPAAVVAGRVAPGVEHIALVQDGHEDRRALRSYFGAWVVCTGHWSPYRISALGKNGAVLASHQGPPRLPDRARPVPEGDAGQA